MPLISRVHAFSRLCIEMSRLVGKPTMWFPNRFVTNRPVKAQMARSVKFNRKALMYYSTSENKGADQFRKADLRLCFCLCTLLAFSLGSSNSVYTPVIQRQPTQMKSNKLNKEKIHVCEQTCHRSE